MTTAALISVVDNAPASALVDLEPARAWILAEAMQRQHSLATGWGGPAYFCGCGIDEGDTGHLLIRVPPGVTECNLTLLVAGLGDVTITSTNDGAVGTRLTWATGGDDLAHVGQVSTVGVLDSSLGANSGRAITVSSSVSWTWQTERLTLTVASGGPGTIHGVLVRPVHVAR